VIILLNWVLVIIIAVIVGGYLASGYLHPFRPCRSCHGIGVRRGAVYRKAMRSCASCGGKGRFRRGVAPPVGEAFGENRRH
jgi:DnaJ-class molecular chaperone